MFGSLFNKPLLLEVAGRTLHFDSKADFEFALASRTEVPAGKISELMRFDTTQLTEEASSVREVERHFVDVLSRSIQEPGSIGYLLREMDMKLFSQDHDWRSIMKAVALQPARFNDFKQLALVKYMQYLASRQDVLKGIYAFKVAGGRTPPVPDAGGAAGMRETVIFDVSDIPALMTGGGQPADDTPGRLARIPRGEQIDLDVEPDTGITLILSRHPYTLFLGDSPALVADDGTRHALARGRNIVGRHPESDVMVDAAYRDVSRTHLIVEVLSAEEVRLTDLSSHGTFVPSGLLGDVPTG